MTPPLQRPALERADVVRRHAHRLGEDLSGEQRRILRAVVSCRTAALGGHVETCDQCQYRRIACNSCRNRHCPKCQASACAQWMEDRADELLPVEYFHVVFTLPDTFNALALGNKRTDACCQSHPRLTQIPGPLRSPRRLALARQAMPVARAAVAGA